MPAASLALPEAAAAWPCASPALPAASAAREEAVPAAALASLAGAETALIHPEDMIAKYHGPVMIIQGSGDALVPMAYAEKAAELYENSELVVIPDDTHGFDLHLDQVTSAVEDFLMELK